MGSSSGGRRIADVAHALASARQALDAGPHDGGRGYAAQAVRHLEVGDARAAHSAALRARCGRPQWQALLVAVLDACDAIDPEADDGEA